MHLLRLLTLAALLLGACIIAWLARAAPLEPGWAGGLIRADGLSALLGAASAGLALAEAPADRRGPWRLPLAAGLLLAAYLTTHLAALAALLILAALLCGGWRPAALLPPLLGAGGLIICALRADTWRYSAPAAGLGLNSVSLALILLAALLAAGAWALPMARRDSPPPAVDPLLGAAALYPLYRLFSLGPWNLGWLFAALLLGGVAAFWAAWRAAAGPDHDARAWLSVYALALGIVGAGLSSGAGVALAAFALLALAPLRLALAPTWPGVQRAGSIAGGSMLEPAASPTVAEPAGGADPTPGGRALLWLLSGAVPLTAPFTVAWAGVAGALAGGLSLLAAGLWAAALLAALPLARMAGAGWRGASGIELAGQAIGNATRAAPGQPDLRLWLAGASSLAIGVGAPGLSALLVEPAVTQLQAGLTPFGELVLWPWAGLLALNAARQPVATLPSLALAALMLVLAALAWAVARLLALWRDRR